MKRHLHLPTSTVSADYSSSTATNINNVTNNNNNNYIPYTPIMNSSTSTSSSSITGSSTADPPVRKRRTAALFLPFCLSRQDSISSSACPVAGGAAGGVMRSATPDSHPLVRSAQSGRTVQFTEDELALIRSTWEHSISEDKLLWCERLFLKLFSMKEQMKKVMGYDGVSPKQLLQHGCPRFEAHCRRFVQFWQDLVDALCPQDSTMMGSSWNEEADDDDDQLVSSRYSRMAEQVVNRIREIGYLHCQMPGVTFDADSWLMFKNIILESVCCSKQHSDPTRCGADPVYRCWAKLVNFVIAEMKDAFHQGVRSRSHTF